MADEVICPLMSSQERQVECVEEKCKWAVKEGARSPYSAIKVNCALTTIVLRLEDIRATLAQELILMTAALKQAR